MNAGRRVNARQSLGPIDVRILITGNGGSGKTWLGERLHLPLIRLDDVYWAGAYGSQGRDKQIVFREVEARAAGEAWVIEGVYGWLLPAALPRATHFVFIDLPVDECLANLRLRGTQGGGDDASLQSMLDWVAEYPNRNNSNSRSAHLRLWEAFDGSKAVLTTRADVDRLAADLPANPPAR